MRVEVNITCDNAAFADDNASRELARMFKGLGAKLEELGAAAPGNVKLYDVNGNPVGSLAVFP